ncbi:cell wall-binding repeat-containing protein [Salinibacterium sp. SWN248]|uniref:cell wall-binding repeat-containing protein n=1 Tax=Salinibacterium sp. SWN248 TaxID=2792056 RepID=UPI0018CF8943|nr:cell wall-binding repeat-containing protein [Salinibacterium sp. SWN248]MBH0023564.1 cell wall-binding repeat-containing protein [Salinibacterium sp. SWN248]
MGLASLLLATIMVSQAAPQQASAISGSEFDPGNIISDAEFYNGNAMTEAEIQSFLNSKSGILKTLRQTVSTRDREVSQTTGNLICEEIKGGSNLLASTMIYRAQVACGISAKVILVTLQKEQGLITNSSPTYHNINFALGYGCPDTPAGCSGSYEGFGYQVFTGTRQFKAYKAANFAKQPGTHTIAYFPNNSSCGSKSVKVTNYATAALYNYTPYVPNSAALANLGGLGDDCSSYGNRNFWYYYYSWFGNPTDIKPTAAVDRIGGANRYETSSLLVNESYPDTGVDKVYIATGAQFPDALSASSAAAVSDAPLLLVSTNSVTSTIKNELVRLAPKEIIVLGGSSIVSDSVFATLQTLSPSVSRVYGSNRYETSRLIAAATFPAGSTTTAFIATGSTFPDALSAGPAAAAAGGPMILVKGSADTLDAPTLELLASLGVTNVSIAGGTGAVSAGIQSQLGSLFGAGNVARYGGADRYATSAAINESGFEAADTVYFATGKNFPDALSGAAAAGAQGAPLYVVGTSCVPKAALQAVIDLGATKVVVLGGTGVLTSDVARYKNCS